MPRVRSLSRGTSTPADRVECVRVRICVRVCVCVCICISGPKAMRSEQLTFLIDTRVLQRLITGSTFLCREIAPRIKKIIPHCKKHLHYIISSPNADTFCINKYLVNKRCSPIQQKITNSYYTNIIISPFLSLSFIGSPFHFKSQVSRNIWLQRTNKSNGASERRVGWEMIGIVMAPFKALHTIKLHPGESHAPIPR